MKLVRIILIFSSQHRHIGFTDESLPSQTTEQIVALATARLIEDQDSILGLLTENYAHIPIRQLPDEWHPGLPNLP